MEHRASLHLLSTKSVTTRARAIRQLSCCQEPTLTSLTRSAVDPWRLQKGLETFIQRAPQP